MGNMNVISRLFSGKKIGSTFLWKTQTKFFCQLSLYPSNPLFRDAYCYLLNNEHWHLDDRWSRLLISMAGTKGTRTMDGLEAWISCQHWNIILEPSETMGSNKSWMEVKNWCLICSLMPIQFDFYVNCPHNRLDLPWIEPRNSWF